MFNKTENPESKNKTAEKKINFFQNNSIKTLNHFDIVR
jgi:hypothetical protein